MILAVRCPPRHFLTPPAQLTGGWKCSWADMETEKSLANYHPGKKQTWFGENLCNLLPTTINLHDETQRQIETTASPHLTPFPRLSFHSWLLTHSWLLYLLLPQAVQGVGEWGLLSVHNTFSPSPSSTHSSPTPVWDFPTGCSPSGQTCSSVALQRLQFPSGNTWLLQCGVLHRLQGISVLVPGAPPPSLSSLILLSARLFFLQFFQLLSLLHGIFYRIWHMLSQRPPSWLRDSAVPCGGSVGAGWNELCLTQGSPSLSSQRLPCSPLLPAPGHPHQYRLFM